MKKAIEVLRPGTKLRICTFHHKAIQLIRKTPNRGIKPKPSSSTVHQKSSGAHQSGQPVCSLDLHCSTPFLRFVKSPLPGGYSIKSLPVTTFVLLSQANLFIMIYLVFP